jgi:hypothetical protein
MITGAPQLQRNDLITPSFLIHNIDIKKASLSTYCNNGEKKEEKRERENRNIGP